MKNLWLRISLKWGLIWIGLSTLIVLLITNFSGQTDPLEIDPVIIIIISSFSWFGGIAVYIVACLDFNRKNAGRISFSQAYGICGFILVFTSIIFTFGSLIYMKYYFVMPEMPEDLVDNGFTKENLFSTKNVVETWAFGLLPQFLIVFIAVTVAGRWKLFQKAGKPGWACIIPIYNLVVMTEIAKKPGWWVVMLFIPIINIIFGIMLINGISKAFGKNEGFTVGLVLLPFIFYPLLGMGDNSYQYAEFLRETDIEDHLVE